MSDSQTFLDDFFEVCDMVNWDLCNTSNGDSFTFDVLIDQPNVEGLLSSEHSDTSDTNQSAGVEGEDVLQANGEPGTPPTSSVNTGAEAPDETQNTSGVVYAGEDVLQAQKDETSTPPASSVDAGPEALDKPQDATGNASTEVALVIESFVDASGNIVDDDLLTGPLFDLFDWGVLVDDITVGSASNALSGDTFDFGPSIGFVDNTVGGQMQATPAFSAPAAEWPTTTGGPGHDTLHSGPSSSAVTLETLDEGRPVFNDTFPNWPSANSFCYACAGFCADRPELPFERLNQCRPHPRARPSTPSRSAIYPHLKTIHSWAPASPALKHRTNSGLVRVLRLYVRTNSRTYAAQEVAWPRTTAGYLPSAQNPGKLNAPYRFSWSSSSSI